MVKRKLQPDEPLEPVEAPEAPDASEAQVEVPQEAAAVIEQVQAELAAAVEARKRALADFANYQRRAAENEGRALRSGAADVIRSLLGALDHFDLALEQDTAQVTVEQFVGGMKIVHDELVKALARQGVKRIEPAAGDEFDPNHHQAVLRQPADDTIAPNHIVSVLQPGYLMGDLVLRPAKVAVAASPDDE
jgi:molecular chaperone GrpE